MIVVTQPKYWYNTRNIYLHKSTDRQGALGLVVKSSLPMRWPRVRFPKGAILPGAIFAEILFVIILDGDCQENE